MNLYLCMLYDSIHVSVYVCVFACCIITLSVCLPRELRERCSPTSLLSRYGSASQWHVMMLINVRPYSCAVTNDYKGNQLECMFVCV